METCFYSKILHNFSLHPRNSLCLDISTSLGRCAKAEKGSTTGLKGNSIELAEGKRMAFTSGLAILLDE
jgi:hypothetical protein